VWERKTTFDVRLHRAAKAGLDVDDADGGAADRAPTRIDDLTGESPRGLALRGDGDGETGTQRARSEEQQSLAPWVLHGFDYSKSIAMLRENQPVV